MTGIPEDGRLRATTWKVGKSYSVEGQRGVKAKLVESFQAGSEDLGDVKTGVSLATCFRDELTSHVFCSLKRG